METSSVKVSKGNGLTRRRSLAAPLVAMAPMTPLLSSLLEDMVWIGLLAGVGEEVEGSMWWRVARMGERFDIRDGLDAG